MVCLSKRSKQMAKTVTHLSKISHRRDTTVTGTLCNRMTFHGDINCTDTETEVTCKLCLREMTYRKRKEAA